MPKHIDRSMQERVAILIGDSCKKQDEGICRESIKPLIEAWGYIPSDKYNYYEAYLVVIQILTLAIKVKNKALIKVWGDHMRKINSQTGDPGSKEMFLGKVNYELGDKKQL